MALPKRVHFSDSPLVISYTPPATPRSTLRTPSPTWSEDSDSDSAPSTPPSTSSFPQRLLPSLSPGSTLSSLSKASSSSSGFGSPLKVKEVNPNPILYDPRAQASLLAWDVATLPAQNASIPSRARSAPKKSFIKAKMVGNSNASTKLSPADLSASATQPAMTSLEIHVPQLPQFWKPIQLRRSGNKASSPITVGDVLDAIHHHLHYPVSQKEFKMLPEMVQKHIARGYWMRHDAVLIAAEGREDAEEVQAVRKAGIKRIDALYRHLAFRHSDSDSASASVSVSDENEPTTSITPHNQLPLFHFGCIGIPPQLDDPSIFDSGFELERTRIPFFFSFLFGWFGIRDFDSIYARLILGLGLHEGVPARNVKRTGQNNVEWRA